MRSLLEFVARRLQLSHGLSVAHPHERSLHNSLESLNQTTPNPTPLPFSALCLATFSARLAAAESRHALGACAVEKGHVLWEGLEHVLDHVLQHALSAVHIVVQVGKCHLWLDHPKFCQVSSRVAVLCAKRGPKGVHATEGAGVSFRLELTRDSEVRGSLEKVAGKI